MGEAAPGGVSVRRNTMPPGFGTLAGCVSVAMSLVSADMSLFALAGLMDTGTVGAAPRLAKRDCVGPIFLNTGSLETTFSGKKTELPSEMAWVVM